MAFISLKNISFENSFFFYSGCLRLIFFFFLLIPRALMYCNNKVKTRNIKIYFLLISLFTTTKNIDYFIINFFYAQIP